MTGPPQDLVRAQNNIAKRQQDLRKSWIGVGFLHMPDSKGYAAGSEQPILVPPSRKSYADF
jgi:hypothetical protein